MTDRKIILGVTGASGGAYALRLLDLLEVAGIDVHLIVSQMAEQILTGECGVKEISAEGLLGRSSKKVHLYLFDDLQSPLASGSFRSEGMVICPCSSNTLGSVACGSAGNLITRAAMVSLKEARKLILVHRETPVSGIDLENMLKVQRAGGIICPASPAFYTRPQSVADMVDFMAGKVLDLLSIEHNVQNRWMGGEAS